MNYRIAPLLLVMVLLGCQDQAVLTFSELALDETRCSECPQVEIHIPQAQSSIKVGKVINRAVKEEIIDILNFDDEVEATNIKEAVKTFSNGFWELKKIYPEETTVWEATIDGHVTYEDDAYVTIELNSYLFTGGAHGYSSKRYLNFDKTNGAELENWQLFQDRENFERFAEQKFRSQEGISPKEPINSTGLMFERDSFYLPENIGLTHEGVKLLYNPYEVASYADGPIEVILPFNEVRPFLLSPEKS